MTDDPAVLPRHVRAAGLCITPGAREWMAHYDFSFEDFRRGKITASMIEATGDSLGMRVAGIAREEAARG